MSGKSVDSEREPFSPDRGARAELRRAKSALDVCMIEAFGNGLLKRLEEKGLKPSAEEVEKLARLAGLVAHVETLVTDTSMGRIMASSKKEGGKVAVSPARFRKLMVIEDPDELYLVLLRVLRMTDRKAHFETLKRACFRWNNDTRRWWALKYYNALPNDQSECAAKKQGEQS